MLSRDPSLTTMISRGAGRSMTSSRYQLGEGPLPSGRHARLLSRAKRIERQLRSLR